jgi:hypothetical protein
MSEYVLKDVYGDVVPYRIVMGPNDRMIKIWPNDDFEELDVEPSSLLSAKVQIVTLVKGLDEREFQLYWMYYQKFLEHLNPKHKYVGIPLSQTEMDLT